MSFRPLRAEEKLPIPQHRFSSPKVEDLPKLPKSKKKDRSPSSIISPASPPPPTKEKTKKSKSKKTAEEAEPKELKKKKKTTAEDGEKKVKKEKTSKKEEKEKTAAEKKPKAVVDEIDLWLEEENGPVSAKKAATPEENLVFTEEVEKTKEDGMSTSVEKKVSNLLLGIFFLWRYVTTAQHIALR